MGLAQMTNDILFRRGDWSVSRDVITTPRMDWKASEVVGVEVSRTPYWAALAIAAAGLLMVWGLSPILYWYEILTSLGMLILVVLLGASIGIMRVSMEALRGTETGQVIGWMPTLIAMRQAIRTVLTESTER